MEPILQTWLEQQCKMIPGARRAVLLTGSADEGPYHSACHWPKAEADVSSLQRVIQAALRSKQAVLKARSHTVEQTSEPLDALACPLVWQGELHGVVAIELTSRAQPLQKAAVQQVQNGVIWLESMIRLHRAQSSEQLIHMIELLGASLGHERFNAALGQVAAELAKRFDCTRVSIGFQRLNSVRVEAISHTKRIDASTNLVKALRDAMVEAIDQGQTIVYPPRQVEAIHSTHFHQQLAKQQKHTEFCTLPLVKNGRAIGTIVFERPLANSFSDAEVERLEQVGLLLGPVLQIRRREERSFFAKAADSLVQQTKKLFGAGYLRLKVTAATAALVLGWLSVATGPFSIATDAQLEANAQRVVVAPQPGYIASAPVRSGDLVQKGQLLAALDDTDLRKEQRRWLTQREQLLKEYRQALAGANRSEVAILQAKRKQSEAQLALIEQQLARTQLVAPFSGVVVKGDLSQSLGAPVERGEVLFEIAPRDGYRVVMKVEDQDIGLIRVGQSGRLRLAAIPDQLIPVEVNRVTPLSTTDQERNVFRVEASLDTEIDLLRPGMEGVSRIEIGEKRKVWIWTRRLMNWLRLFLWHWTP